MAISHSVCHVTTLPSSHARSRAASNIHRGHDKFKAAKNSSLLFYDKVKQRKLACGIRIVLHNVEWLCLLHNWIISTFWCYLYGEKNHAWTNVHLFSVCFFVPYFILTRNVIYAILTLQIRIKIMLNWDFTALWHVELCQFYIMYINSVCMHWRSDIGTILI